MSIRRFQAWVRLFSSSLLGLSGLPLHPRLPRSAGRLSAQNRFHAGLENWVISSVTDVGLIAGMPPSAVPGAVSSEEDRALAEYMRRSCGREWRNAAIGRWPWQTLPKAFRVLAGTMRNEAGCCATGLDAAGRGRGDAPHARSSGRTDRLARAAGFERTRLNARRKPKRARASSYGSWPQPPPPNGGVLAEFRRCAARRS